MGKQEGLDIRLSNKIWELVKNYIDTGNFPKKAQSKIQWYYLANKLLKQLYDSKLSLKQIMSPTCDKSSILLIKYLIPFLDMWNNVHPDRKEYNYFVYDYIFDTKENTEKNYPFVYIIKDINSPGQRIEKISFENALLFTKQYSLTITGCCFDKHEDNLGLFTETLINLKRMRKEYKDNMFKYPKGSEKANFWNSRQLSTKVAMNSIYGIMGLKTFRYSNHNLAQAVTTSGRLANKLAQYLAEQHLKEKYNEN
ncbi:MAG: hypothetical protein H8D97_00280 [Proteobacteria bacterium]|nr:hypothetical protein [Pseudomonadota bacterium]